MSHLLRGEPVRNVILSGLPADEFACLSTLLTRVRLVPQQVLIELDEPPEHVYFIERGIVSIRDAIVSAPSVQVAVIGRESMVGSEALLEEQAPICLPAVSQYPGVAIRLSIRDIRQVLPSCPSFERCCKLAAIALMRQIIETASFNVRYSLTQRCVRLLLMFHDRVDGEEVQITHEALSVMLGVRRAGVTMVATDLQDDGLVKVDRGRITIVDRSGLERHLPKSFFSGSLDGSRLRK